MPNITPEHYKNAIKEKYEKEKHGDNIRFLQNPSQAKLRNLCWEIFLSNSNQDDLKTFADFFEFSFDLTKKKFVKEKTDRFKSIGAFFRGETESPTDEKIELAAILVDFQPRPYNKFRKIGFSEEKTENPNESKSFILEEIKEKNKEKEGDENEVIEDLSINNKKPNTLSERFTRKLKWTMVTTTVVFCLIATVIYFAFFKKDCMQWTGGYYEKVDCVQEINSLVDFSDIKPFDERQFELKKIQVCDTTSFFKLGKPCVWYGKSIDGSYDCFTLPGLHPETGKTLKPITHYMISKHILRKKK